MNKNKVLYIPTGFDNFLLLNLTPDSTLNSHYKAISGKEYQQIENFSPNAVSGLSRSAEIVFLHGCTVRFRYAEIQFLHSFGNFSIC